jgi:DNA-binding MarR family transcriptional regulator
MKKEAVTTFSLISEFGRPLKSRMREQGAPECPSMPQVEVLQAVAEHDSPTMHEIALLLKVKAPSATALVGELVRAGLLMRESDASDRRQVRLAMTRKGVAALEAAVARRKKVISSVLSPLEARDRAQFNRLLQKILNS